MAKKSKKIIESMDFNNTAHAQSVIEESTKKLEKSKPALIVSAVATAASFLSMCVADNATLSTFLMLAAFIGSMVSYILGGGFSIALRAAKKVAFFGWLVFPFPTDLVVGLVTLFFSIWAFFCLPIVFVYINIRQLKKNVAEAEEYIKYCEEEAIRMQAYANAPIMNPAYANAAPVYANAPYTNANPAYTNAAYTNPNPMYANATPVYANTINNTQAFKNTSGNPCPPPFKA